MSRRIEKNIILTGATGFLGRNTLNVLIERGYKITAIVRRITPDLELHVKDNSITVIEKTLIELSREDFPKNEEYYALIHFAWGGVNRNEINSTTVHNESFSMSKNCLEVAKDLGITRFVNCGTRAEYGKLEGIYSEEKDCNPTNAYGIEKLRFYFFALEFCRANSISFAHIRPFSVIGPGDHPWSLIQSACTTLKANGIMRVGKCNQLWNFLDISDFANCVVDILESIDIQCDSDNPIYNIASTDTRPLNSFLEELEKIVDGSGCIEYDSYDEHEPPISLNPSIEKVSRLTAFKEKNTFRSSIERILVTGTVKNLARFFENPYGDHRHGHSSSSDTSR